jgi:hypothetical protein
MAAPLNFRSGIAIYVMCAAAAWFAWPWIKANFVPDMRPYEEPASVGARNHSGITPFDPFGLRPDRNRDVAGRQRMNLDPNEVSPNVEDRRGDPGDLPAGTGGGDIGRTAGLRCRDNVTGRDVPLSFCERGGR